MLTAERLRELLHYDAESGQFVWLQSRGKARRGKVAGCVFNNGYLMIMVNSRAYCASRLAWLYVNGSWPNGQIDHINRDKLDNRIANLREATATQNCANRVRSAPNIAGLKGVQFQPRMRSKPWRAVIEHKGKARIIGSFETPEAAHSAYMAVAQEIHGEFARTA